MQNKIISLVKENSWIGVKASDLAWTVGLTVAIVIAPAILAHTPANQIVTGSIVNALLFLAVYKMPLVNALMIAVIPSSVALLRGLLPAPMAILIPYIMLSNIILMLSFLSFKKTPLIGVLMASFLKFGFLYGIVSLVAHQLNPTLITMFQLPQLITALIGGFIFLSLIKFYKIKS